MSPKCWQERERDDESDNWTRDLLIEPILEEFPFYGHRKVTKELQRRRWHVNKKKIQRIMQRFGLVKKRRIYKPKTTNSRHGLPIHPNLVKDVVPSFPNQIWVADITYIKLAGGECCYLALSAVRPVAVA